LKYTFNIQVSSDKNQHAEKLIIPAFDNEAAANIILKVLAYLMFIDRRPSFDDDPGWQAQPDLIARDSGGTITLWVDCGSVSTKKLDTVATKIRDIQFVVFRKTRKDMEHFYRTIQDKAKYVQNVRCVSFDDRFVDGIAEHLDRTNDIECYIGDDMITFNIANSLGRHDAYTGVHRIGADGDD
jgi:uncharacterized protein YaeQ